MADVVNSIQNVPKTFSSWDSCMSKAYCKWPVIGAIIVGSIIVLCIIWCIASCLCCGATICGSCVKCLTCGKCCGLCGKRNRDSRHKDDYSRMPSPYEGYRGHSAPMSYNHGPQFASFDTSGKKNATVHEDALPAMPSWGAGTTKRVEAHDPELTKGRDVEMGHVDTTQRPTKGAYDALPHQEPLSPTFHGALAPPYDANHGTRRGNAYDSHDFEHSPLSPAPAYRTHEATAGANRSYYDEHRSPLSATSGDDRHYGHDNTSGAYSSSAQSTRYEQETYQPYQATSPAPNSDRGFRPPSFLKIGHRPAR